MSSAAAGTGMPRQIGVRPGRIELRGLPPRQLAQVPLGVHEREVGEGHVGPDALDLLGVPEREGVVVAGGDEDAVGLDRL